MNLADAGGCSGDENDFSGDIFGGNGPYYEGNELEEEVNWVDEGEGCLRYAVDYDLQNTVDEIHGIILEENKS